MKIIAFTLMFSCLFGFGARQLPGRQTQSSEDHNRSSPAPAPPSRQEETPRAYSGTYTFLKEGEFVQLTVEDDNRVTGFISRFEESENEKGGFLDQFFKTGQIEGNRLTFTTQLVRGVAYQFKGAVERGDGKNPGDEDYFVLKGTLTTSLTDASKKVTSRSQDVTFRLFPKDAAPAAGLKRWETIVPPAPA
jgi:hypothetical protein